MNAIFKRTSVRDYSKKPIKKKVIKKLLKAAMAAPSAGNQQPWEFIVVDDSDTLNKLSCYSPYSKPVAKSQVSIVLLMRAKGLRFGALAQQDMAACAENILLEATELGLGSVWQCAFPEANRMQYITDLFGLPANLIPFAVISLGYPKKGAKREQQDRFDEKRIHWNGRKAKKKDAKKLKKDEKPEVLNELETETVPGFEGVAADIAEEAETSVEPQAAAAEVAEAESQELTGWRSATNAAVADVEDVAEPAAEAEAPEGTTEPEPQKLTGWRSATNAAQA